MKKKTLFATTCSLLALTMAAACTPVQPAGENRTQTESSSFPVTVQSCGDTFTFDAAPERAMAFDTNMTEIMLALGLEDRMVGYWVSGVPISDKYKEQIKDIPLVSTELWPPPGLETILSFNPDFVFGAWEYVFFEESGVTPERLAAAGVRSYTLTESCIEIGVRPDPTFEGTYQDILNIGRIFGVDDRAQAIVQQMRTDIEAISKKIGNDATPLRAMYYGGGSDAAFTTGLYGMPTKLMTAVGAENILADVEDDWIPSANWESIIERDPEVIIIDDTPWESAEARINTLKSLPQLADVTAVREERFVVLPWTYILPGVDVDEGVAALAKALYPKLFE